ncbi:MAG: peptidylprolyl isomerase [Acidobacteria bacterium]|nr:peptidylprolyl isomerase [Acidobacteriota bacterium]
MLGWARKSKGVTKIILGLVVIATVGSLALAMYGLWGGGLAGKEQGAPDWIANVDGEPIPTKAFIKTRGIVENDLRQRFAGQASDDALSAFVDQQALGTVLGQYLTEREATRAGLRVTPAELKDDIVSMPQWQRDGRFIGADQYRKILESARINIAEFEGEREKEIAAEKLRAAVFSLARIDDAEVDRRFRSEVERVDLDYVLLADASFTDAKEPAAADTKSYYESHRADYMTAEARRAGYVLFDREAKAASAQVSDAEINDAYEKGKATTYTHPDQRRASHILFKVPQNATPAQDAEIRAKAAAVLARARGGEDFAALARQSSEDSGSAASGGDLGFFGRNRMVKEFEDAAFSLSVGAVSDLVKTPFGYHIMKVTEARTAGVDPLSEVKDEIRRGLAVAKSQEALRVEAQAFQGKLAAQEASFDKSAAAMGYKVGDTGFFAKGEPAGPLGWTMPSSPSSREGSRPP